MTKDAGGLLTFGPVWDFESGPSVMYDPTLLGTHFCYDVPQQYIWYEQAWKKGDFVHMMAEMNAEMQGVIDQMFGRKEATVIWNIDELSEIIRPSHEMNWLRWDQPSTYEDWRQWMRDALEIRYNNWFGTLWNSKRQFLGLTAEAADNGDGTWTLTAEFHGKTDSDYPLWYKVGDDPTSGELIGNGFSIVVPAGGKYYAAATGPNNAYSSNATGKVFKSKSITMISNILSSPGDHAQSGVIEPGSQYDRLLQQVFGTGTAGQVAGQTAGQTAGQAAAGQKPDETAPAGPSENEPAQADGRTEKENASKSVPSGGRISDTAWILVTVCVVALSTVMIVNTLFKKPKGGRAHASR